MNHSFTSSKILDQRLLLLEQLDQLDSILLAENHTKASYILKKNRFRYLVHLQNIILSRPNGPILDFGAGYPFLQFILNHIGINCFSYEPYQDEDIIRVSNSIGFHNLNSLSPIKDLNLSGLILNDVVEHIPLLLDLCNQIKDLSYVSNAILSLSTPNVFRARMWASMIIRRHHLPTSIEAVLTSTEADSIHIREYSSSNLRSIARSLDFTRNIDIRYEKSNLFSDKLPIMKTKSMNSMLLNALTFTHPLRDHIYLLANK